MAQNPSYSAEPGCTGGFCGGDRRDPRVVGILWGRPQAEVSHLGGTCNQLRNTLSCFPASAPRSNARQTSEVEHAVVVSIVSPENCWHPLPECDIRITSPQRCATAPRTPESNAIFASMICARPGRRP